MNDNYSGRDKNSIDSQAATYPDKQPKDAGAAPSPTGDRKTLKLIPWEDIWTSLRAAQLRGNGDMIEVFYDTLFRDAIFDDDGVWALDLKKR